VVKNFEAFLARYGDQNTSKIAGEYTGSLSNRGERITLLDTHGRAIHCFRYDDSPPWPTCSDGIGMSLILIGAGDPVTPDHTEPFNWRSSLSKGGNPGRGDEVSYLSWSHSNGITPRGFNRDPDIDGNENLLEYARGTVPTRSDERLSLTVSFQEIVRNGDTVKLPIFYFDRHLLSDEAKISVELSEDLREWNPASGSILFLGRERIGEVHERLLFSCSDISLPTSNKFFRFRITHR